MIHHGFRDGIKVAGDLFDVGVVIYVALDIQPSRLFVDRAEITRLFLWEGTRERNETDQGATRCLRGFC